jgi:hypothetical protein
MFFSIKKSNQEWEKISSFQLKVDNKDFFHLIAETHHINSDVNIRITHRIIDSGELKHDKSYRRSIKTSEKGYFVVMPPRLYPIGIYQIEVLHLDKKYLLQLEVERKFTEKKNHIAASSYVEESQEAPSPNLTRPVWNNRDENAYDEHSLQTLLQQILAGKAILFTGAGFSLGTKNIIGDEPPMAKDLSRMISKLGKFKESDNLKFTSDYYLEHHNHQGLIDLLKKNYSLKSVSKSHETICGTSWRRIYTTNYDESIELAGRNAGKRIDGVTVEEVPKINTRRSDICVHINGSIRNLSIQTLGSEFKLSNSSYISSDAFTQSQWHHIFRNDLLRCSAIVFIGYSLYDIEVQKLLVSCSKPIKQKTYFIVDENPGIEMVHQLGKFGSIFPIGLDLFSEKLALFKQEYRPIDDDGFKTLAFTKYEYSDTNRHIGGLDITNFLLYGYIEPCHIDYAITANQSSPYLVIREHMELAIRFITVDKKSLVVTGGFGNGKSVFLQSLRSHFSILGLNVYFLDDDGGDYIADIDLLSKLDQEIILIIDGYDKYPEILDLIKHLAPTNITLLLAARSSNHNRIKSKLPPDCREICIDIVNSVEADKGVDILESGAMWGDKVNFSRELKKDFVCRKKEFSVILLELLKAPQIHQRITELVELIFEQDSLKDTTFVVCLLSVLGYDRPVHSLIGDLSGHDDIYNTDHDTAARNAFRQFFYLRDNIIECRSSIFSLTFLSKYFKASYIREKLLDISQRYGNFEASSSQQVDIAKQIRRFSIVDKIMPEQGKKQNIRQYYVDLQRVLPWLKSDPHYWLQYGMSHILHEEYTEAQRYLETAYELANTKGWDTSYIDNQYARIFLQYALDPLATNKKSFENFEIAHHRLLKASNNEFRYRQVYDLYQQIFYVKYPKYPIKDKVKFEHHCKYMYSQWKESVRCGNITPREKNAHTVGSQLEKIISDSYRPPSTAELK